MPPVKHKQVDVAVGIVMQHGKVLLAWRHHMLDQGDCYEFPGGKIEPGETPLQALKRELKEEIAIEVLQATPLSIIKHQYPSKAVCLHVYVVSAFAGTPHGQQGQSLRWVDTAELATLPLPEANGQIVRQLGLPLHYAILPEFASDYTLCAADLALYTPQCLLYVRQPQASAGAYVALLAQLRQLRPDLRLVIAATHFTACQLAIADFNTWCEGVHYNSIALAELAAYPNTTVTFAAALNVQAKMLRIAAVHTMAELQMANALGMDAVTISPVQRTNSHINATILGWQGLHALALQANMPVYALGGLALADLPVAHKHGAYGIAGIGMYVPTGPVG